MSRRQIEQILAPAIGALGFECLGVEWSTGRRGGRLRVFIDAPEGVRIEDCERVSHEIESLLDLHDPVGGPYVLEVSSPGIDRPLFSPEHFARHLGAVVAVTLEEPLGGRRRLQGSIAAVAGDRIALDCGGERIELEHRRIARARLVPDWEKIMSERAVARPGREPGRGRSRRVEK